MAETATAAILKELDAIKLPINQNAAIIIRQLVAEADAKAANIVILNERLISASNNTEAQRIRGDQAIAANTAANIQIINLRAQLAEAIKVAPMPGPAPVPAPVPVPVPLPVPVPVPPVVAITPTVAFDIMSERANCARIATQQIPGNWVYADQWDSMSKSEILTRGRARASFDILAQPLPGAAVR